MAKKNHFRKLEASDYQLFLKYYTQIEYSYFTDDNPMPKAEKEQRTKLATYLSNLTFPRNVSQKDYEGLLEQAEFYLYIEEETKEVLGIIAYYGLRQEERMSIHEFYVLKKYQRKHIGTQMYEDFLFLLKDQWYFKVYITLMCSFNGAEEFWRKMGYELIGKEDEGTQVEKRYYGKTERPVRMFDKNHKNMSTTDTTD